MQPVVASAVNPLCRCGFLSPQRIGAQQFASMDKARKTRPQSRENESKESALTTPCLAIIHAALRVAIVARETRKRR